VWQGPLSTIYYVRINSVKIWGSNFHLCFSPWRIVILLVNSPLNWIIEAMICCFCRGETIVDWLISHRHVVALCPDGPITWTVTLCPGWFLSSSHFHTSPQLHHLPFPRHCRFHVTSPPRFNLTRPFPDTQHPSLLQRSFLRVRSYPRISQLSTDARLSRRLCLPCQARRTG